MKKTVQGNGPERVLFLLKQQGPADAESLASKLEVSGAAIRQHLYNLRGQGLVFACDEARPMGRPAKIWDLTSAASSRFPQTSSPMIESLLRSTQKVLGASGMETAICGCVEDQLQRYRQNLARHRSLPNRLNALVEMRNKEGFMAILERESKDSFLLSQNHCPISGAVTDCSQLCDAELLIFKQLFHHLANIERLDHMVNGDRRCTYRIVRKSKMAHRSKCGYQE